MNQTNYIVTNCFNIQTCDGGGHKRKDRPNGGMYITEDEMVNTISTQKPVECCVVQTVGLFDMQGGKPGCNFNDGSVCPVITRGRASVSDVHAVVQEVR